MNNRKLLLEVIKELESTDKRSINFCDFTIIKITQFPEEIDKKNKYYAIYIGGAYWHNYWKKPGLIGEGGFGSVYLTFQINILSEHAEIVGFDLEKNRPKIHAQTKSPEIDPTTKKSYQLFVTKVVDMASLNKHDINAENFLLKEVEVFGKYYYAEPYVIGIGTNAYIITEYLTGEKLTPELIKKLTYPERLAIIQELLFNINLMHHETHRTGPAFIHKDIKPDNINVYIQYNDAQNPKSGIKKISVHLMDFGLARIIEDDNPNRMFQNNRHWGTTGYIAPEVFWGAAGINLTGDIGLKSDIYSLTPVILMILGSSDPITTHLILYNFMQEHPNDLDWQIYKSSKALPEYDFSGIFEGCVLPDKNIQFLIILLLKRMQSNHYAVRPNSDELLKFFSILRIYESLNTQEKEFKSDVIYNKKSTYLANLILLVYGQWSQENEEHLLQDENNIKAAKIIQQWSKAECVLDLSDIFPAKESTTLMI